MMVYLVYVDVHHVWVVCVCEGVCGCDVGIVCVYRKCVTYVVCVYKGVCGVRACYIGCVWYGEGFMVCV